MVEFAVVLWGGVDVPADAVGVVVDEEGATVGTTKGVELGDGGFGELSGGEVFDDELEIKESF